MKIVIFTILLTCASLLVHSQDHKSDQKDYYMSLKTFRKMVSDTIDISYLRYKIKHGDTIVPYKRSLGGERNDLNKVKYILKDTTFLTIYKPIAYRSVNKAKPYHRFWNDDVVLFFGKSVPKKHKKFLISFIEDNLSDIDNLTIKTTNKLQNSNFIIYYDGDFEYEGRFTNDYKNRNTYYSYWKGNDLSKVVLKLIPDFYSNEETMMSDLVRNLVINLGYFNTSNLLSCKSVFSNCNTYVDELTLLDKEILRYHYSRGFCVGMDLKSFEIQDDQAREFYKYNPESDYYVLFKKDRF